MSTNVPERCAAAVAGDDPLLTAFLDPDISDYQDPDVRPLQGLGPVDGQGG